MVQVLFAVGHGKWIDL